VLVLVLAEDKIIGMEIVRTKRRTGVERRDWSGK